MSDCCSDPAGILAMSIKRGSDLILAVIGVAVLSPLMLIVGLAIRWKDGPPVLFCQSRVGQSGKDFRIFKFRTMTNSSRAQAGAFDAGNRTKITRLGQILRALKLDELPQLWNVIRGDMSLVGPRPEVRKWVEVFPQRWAYVHRVKPGISDPASILFRHEERVLAAAADPEKTYAEVILPRKLALYEEYVRTQSLWGDIKILWMTLIALVKPFRGAAD